MQWPGVWMAVDTTERLTESLPETTQAAQR
jgi:hypothetical protein